MKANLPTSLPRFLLTITGMVLLSACDPLFETTPQLCANAQSSGVGFSVSNMQVDVDADEYQLYLQDILAALQPADGVTLNAEETEAKNFIEGKIKEYMGYPLPEENAVFSANNPLDYLESIIATTSSNTAIGAFEQAKQQVARGIAADNDFCTYTNNNIIVTIEDNPDTTTVVESGQLFAEFALSYNPFSRIVQQSVVISDQSDGLTSAEKRSAAPYVGFFQAQPENFKAVGYTQPILRQALVQNSALTETLGIDDGYDNRLGQVLLDTTNTYCDEDGDSAGSNIDNLNALEKCPDGTTTRTVVKSECAGDLSNADESDDGETDKIEERSFYLTSSYPSIKRIRIELDYVDETVEIFASEFVEAIHDSDSTEGDVKLILDPTDCEKQVVLDELFINQGEPEGGVKLQLYEDPNYDIVYQVDEFGNRETDENGDAIILQEPTPIYSYTGTARPARKVEL